MQLKAKFSHIISILFLLTSCTACLASNLPFGYDAITEIMTELGFSEMTVNQSKSHSPYTQHDKLLLVHEYDRAYLSAGFTRISAKRCIELLQVAYLSPHYEHWIIRSACVSILGDYAKIPAKSNYNRFMKVLFEIPGVEREKRVLGELLRVLKNSGHLDWEHDRVYSLANCDRLLYDHLKNDKKVLGPYRNSDFPEPKEMQPNSHNVLKILDPKQTSWLGQSRPLTPGTIAENIFKMKMVWVSHVDPSKSSYLVINNNASEGFWLSKRPVCKDFYRLISRSTLDGRSSISAGEASRFSASFSEHLDCDYRLPTKAELAIAFRKHVRDVYRQFENPDDCSDFLRIIDNKKSNRPNIHSSALDRDPQPDHLRLLIDTSK